MVSMAISAESVIGVEGLACTPDEMVKFGKWFRGIFEMFSFSHEFQKLF